MKIWKIYHSRLISENIHSLFLRVQRVICYPEWSPPPLRHCTSELSPTRPVEALAGHDQSHLWDWTRDTVCCHITGCRPLLPQPWKPGWKCPAVGLGKKACVWVGQWQGVLFVLSSNHSLLSYQIKAIVVLAAHGGSGLIQDWATLDVWPSEVWDLIFFNPYF